MQVSQKVPKPCVSCAQLTKFICVDCSIDGKGFVPLCLNPNCKRKHDLEKKQLANNVK